MAGSRFLQAGLAIAALGMFGCGPMVMFPGGRLSGDVRPAPGDWAFSESIEVVQIETRPNDPYSVNIWGAAKDGTFYVMAADGERRWVQNIRADPNVRLKVCDDVYEMKAVEVSDPASIEGVLEAMVAKYDLRPTALQRREGRLFKLEAR